MKRACFIILVMFSLWSCGSEGSLKPGDLSGWWLELGDFVPAKLADPPRSPAWLHIEADSLSCYSGFHPLFQWIHPGLRASGGSA